MADQPADDDEQTRVDEWRDDKPTEVAEGVPELVESTTPRPDVTGRHRLTPAQFASAIDLTDRDAYQRGFQHGHTKGLAEGRAEVRAEDWEDGVECALRGVRLWMASRGIVNVDAATTAAKPFIKRGG